MSWRGTSYRNRSSDYAIVSASRRPWRQFAASQTISSRFYFDSVALVGHSRKSWGPSLLREFHLHLHFYLSFGGETVFESTWSRSLSASSWPSFDCPALRSSRLSSHRAPNHDSSALDCSLRFSTFSKLKRRSRKSTQCLQGCYGVSIVL